MGVRSRLGLVGEVANGFVGPHGIGICGRALENQGELPDLAATHGHCPMDKSDSPMARGPKSAAPKPLWEFAV